MPCNLEIHRNTAFQTWHYSILLVTCHCIRHHRTKYFGNAIHCDHELDGTWCRTTSALLGSLEPEPLPKHGVLKWNLSGKQLARVIRQLNQLPQNPLWGVYFFASNAPESHREWHCIELLHEVRLYAGGQHGTIRHPFLSYMPRIAGWGTAKLLKGQMVQISSDFQEAPCVSLDDSCK